MAADQWPKKFFRNTIRETVRSLVAISPAPKDKVLRLIELAPKIGTYFLEDSHSLPDSGISFSYRQCEALLGVASYFNDSKGLVRIFAGVSHSKLEDVILHYLLEILASLPAISHMDFESTPQSTV
jgi:hypothetical protein